MSAIEQIKAAPMDGQAPAPINRGAGGLLQSRWAGWAFVGFLACAWEIAARSVESPNWPALSGLLVHGWTTIASGVLPQAIGETLWRLTLGYLVAVLIGTSLGLVTGSSRVARSLLEPVLEMARPVPISAFVPLLILFFGIGAGMKIWVAFIGALFPILLNTQAGVASVPRTLLETAETYRLTAYERTVEIILPWALPSIFVGLRLAIGTALIVSVVAEMIAGNSGIGFFILQGQQTLTVKDLYVGIFTLGLVGYLLNALFLFAESRLLHWHGSARRS